MMRNFYDGYLYVLTGADYQNQGRSNIVTPHIHLCYYGEYGEKTLFLCNEPDIQKIQVREGVIKPSTDLKDVGDWAADDISRFVICYANQERGDTVYVTVALLY